MQNETDKLIEGQFKSLPEELQKSINAVSWKSIVQEIGQQNKLGQEKIADLERETMFIIYGFEPPESFVENVMREVGTDESQTKKIVEAIVERILNVIVARYQENETKDDRLLEAPKELVESKQGPSDKPVAEAAKAPEPAPTPTPVPKPKMASYPGGVDPYREPTGI